MRAEEAELDLLVVEEKEVAPEKVEGGCRAWRRRGRAFLPKAPSMGFEAEGTKSLRMETVEWDGLDTDHSEHRETTHFLIRREVVVEDQRQLVWELRMGASGHCHVPFPLFQMTLVFPWAGGNTCHGTG